jgi:hypothetical protein
MMVAGTAASVGIALVNERRLTPAYAESAPQPLPAAAPAVPAATPRTTTVRELVTRHMMLAVAIGVAFFVLAGTFPAVTMFASSLRSPAEYAAPLGPPIQARAAAGVAGNWEQSYSAAAPPADQMGAALMAAAVQRQDEAVYQALRQIDAARTARAAAMPSSLNAASGLSAGTVIRARITIYGCTGPGGGFCHHMYSGIQAFPGAAACSNNLPLGTKLTIAGDPTGRVYECLDRGSLSPTWIDVYFEDTTDGMAWQSQLGSTVSEIEIQN